jgi:hypothetical protein
MRGMKVWFLYGLALVLLDDSEALAASAAKLLDEVIRTPGQWSQMCASPPPLPFDVPLPLYALATPRYFSLSQANAARLLKRRDDVVPEIVARLSKFDFSMVKPGPASFSTLEFRQDPNHLSGLMLQIILELKAVETLPQLLRLEANLNQRLEAALTNPSGLPSLDLNSPVTWQSDSGARFTDGSEEQRRVFAGRVLQRETLSVIAALLRQERFQPLLQSEYERNYALNLKREAGGEELRKIKTPSDIPREATRWIAFDPVYQLPVRRTWLAATMPYSSETRQQIRGFSEDFLKERRDAGIPQKSGR